MEIRIDGRESVACAMVAKINEILEPNTQSKARCKIIKILLVICDEWMKC